MREATSSTRMGKPIVALIDMDASRGGLQLHQVHDQLIEAEVRWLPLGLLPLLAADTLTKSLELVQPALELTFHAFCEGIV